MNKQITEDYVSYEIAVLLKEKGFDNEEVSENGGFYCDYECDGKDIGIVYESQMLNKDLARNEYLRPTHQMALKWLREVHKIFVEPFVSIDLNGKYHYCFRLLNSICKDIFEPKDLVRIDFKDSYEEAVEVALLYVLKNLI